MSWKCINKQPPQVGRIAMEIESLKAEIDPQEFIEAMDGVAALAIFQRNAVAKKLEPVK